ncbi:SKP1-like protein 1B-like, partial [Trifolium medium]|nr:SKP1-like protein 1B-like [Trifolium medium]
GIIETIPVGDIFVHEVSSNILTMVIEYCKKHKHNNGLKDFELKDLDDHFVNVDPKTMLDLFKSACYLKVNSLLELIDNLKKGKTPEEIYQIFGIEMT